ncbi:MAG: ABC transporter ATP-binding protein, partial [Clostridia bacterium]|nr:ABC transporter ATP-binding protein [Clostridia bacterium]
MKLILRYIKPFAFLTCMTLFIKLFGSLMELSIPMIFDFIVSDVVPLKSVPAVIFWGVVMILAALCTMILNVVANRMASRVSRNVAERVRHDLFEKISALSGAEVDRFGIPSLEARLTSDTYNIHNVVGSTLRIGVRAPIFFIGSIICAFILDPPLTLVMLASTPFIGIVILYITKHGVPLYTKVQTGVDGITRIVREDAQGIRVIKALSKGDYERRRFDRANHDLVVAEKRAGIAMAISNPALNVILNLGMVAVIIVGAIRVANGEMHPATIIAFTQYFTHMSNAMMSISRVFTRITKGAASGDRIDEVLA